VFLVTQRPTHLFCFLHTSLCRYIICHVYDNIWYYIHILSYYTMCNDNIIGTGATTRFLWHHHNIILLLSIYYNYTSHYNILCIYAQWRSAHIGLWLMILNKITVYDILMIAYKSATIVVTRTFWRAAHIIIYSARCTTTTTSRRRHSHDDRQKKICILQYYIICLMVFISE